MPELPEVETIRQSLEPRLVGATIRRVRVLRRDVVEGPVSPRALLSGCPVSEIQRHGKQLAILTGGPDAPCVTLHLGMSGRLTLAKARSKSPSRPPHTHVVWSIDDPAGPFELWFTDPRRFGGIRTHATLEELLTGRWGALGPDALSHTEADLRKAVEGRRRPLKASLLDQRSLAGIGNIYADESLFDARLHPARRSADLTPEETRRLSASIRRTLRQAVLAKGSTLRDYRTPDGGEGGFAASHAVYARGGRPCVRCQHTLHTQPCAGRTTTFCPVCQT